MVDPVGKIEVVGMVKRRGCGSLSGFPRRTVSVQSSSLLLLFVHGSVND
jgi:hypothetical protein